ncbi:MAG: MAPEG family protein [Hyphomicrobiales bacterium]|nr:MAPEG family protein [Hyphomicrobiales bacterium]MBV9054703.1 MAPEG family protein [Hyphomicrobiales bacterium]
MLMLVGLAIFVINRRRTAGVGLGDGGNKALAKAVRAHGNFTEYAPFAIAAYVLLALSGVSAVFIHVLGTVFIVGRVAHAAGLSQHEGASVGRAIGVAATMIVLIAASLRLLMGALG